MNKGIFRIIALLAALALAGTLAGCGGEATPAPEPTESAAVADDAEDADATDADATDAEDPADDAEEFPDEGDGPVLVDVGFFAVDLPEGLNYSIRNSYAQGNTLLNSAFVRKGDDKVVFIEVGAGAMVHSVDDAKERVDGILKHYEGKTLKKWSEVKVGGRTYQMIVFKSDSLSTPNAHLTDYDKDLDAHISLEVPTTKDGKDFKFPDELETVMKATEFKKP